MTSSNVLQSLDFRLTYADTDPLGIVYFAAYYPWMERTYNEWLFKTGFINAETQRRFGLHSVIRTSGCEYLAAGVLYDALRCTLSAGSIGNTSFRLDFKIQRRRDDMLLATGFMTLVMVDRDNKPSSVPNEFRECFDRS